MTTSTLKTNKRQKLTDIGCHRSKRSKAGFLKSIGYPYVYKTTLEVKIF